MHGLIHIAVFSHGRDQNRNRVSRRIAKAVTDGCSVRAEEIRVSVDCDADSHPMLILAGAFLVAQPAWSACGLTVYNPTWSAGGATGIVTAKASHGTTCPSGSTLTTELWHQKPGPDSRLAANSGVGASIMVTASAPCLVTGGTSQAAYYTKGISSSAGTGTSGILWKDC
jgi:hypothetical protein